MNIRKLTVAALAVAAVAAVGIGVAVAASDDDNEGASEPFTFEVAENGTRFAFDEAPVFDFGGFDGDDAVITNGVEISDIGVEVRRAIVGGTGEHVGAVGVQHQVLEAFNDSAGVNLSITFEPAED